ncbi:LysR substrate-binding domain-containing protein [Curvivirga sp.]|uniref:LysR substrate-binding domain-containing protein n=1 Tax=Curvivirga sp. TaxID=2856848 RepID=UPI003B5B4DCC
MRRHIPTFSSVLCFEASARHLSFTRAAEELNLTQSAVSRQVQSLEEFLKTPLFKRIKKRLHLTEEGIAFAESASDILDKLEAESLKLISRELDEQVLNLGTFPTFGSRWLIPRLPDFNQQNPDLQLNFTTSVTAFDFAHQNIDIAIQHGDGNWPNVHAEELIREDIVAVCAPSLIEGKDEITSQSVLDHSMLRLKTRPYAWTEWLEAHNIPQPHKSIGPQFETFGYMIRAALAGLGVAIIPPMFVEEELRDNRLIAPFGNPIQSQRGYYLVTSQKKKDLEKVHRFSSWIKSLI